MYINFNYLKEKDLTLKDLLALLIIFNNVNGDACEHILGEVPMHLYNKLKEKDLIKHVKSKNKSEPFFASVRLSTKGKETLKLVSVADLEEEDIKLIEYLKTLFKNLDKPIGNEKMIQKLIPWFRVTTQYSRKMIYIATKTFINQEVEKSQGKFIPSLENLLWKAPNVFSTKWDLGSSRLYKFIQENKEILNEYISTKK